VCVCFRDVAEDQMSRDLQWKCVCNYKSFKRISVGVYSVKGELSVRWGRFTSLLHPKTKEMLHNFLGASPLRVFLGIIF